MTQFIFQRRDIQAWLNSMKEQFSETDLIEFAKRLNSGDRLEAMWEVALLNSISKETNFKHEEPLENGRKPDFQFTLQLTGQNINIYGDITALSDEGVDKQNPIAFFMEELFRQRKKYNLLDMNIDTRVHHYRNPDDFRAKTRLLLPPKGDIPKVIRKSVIPVLRAWKENGTFEETRRIDEDGLSLSVSRRASSQFSSAGFAGYRNVGKVRDSPLYKKLKNKKSQLSGTPDGALNLIIICDGGSHVIKPSLLYSPLTVDFEEICRSFLRENSSLDMILLIAVNTLLPQVFGISAFDKELRANFIHQEGANRKAILTDYVVAETIKAINRWLGALPIPLMSPDNARRLLKEQLGPTPKGAMIMSGEKIHLPSRRVMELLSGISSPEEWQNDYEGSGVNPVKNLTRMLMEGRMITSVEVEKRENSDDDWLIFKFGEPDAATAPFTAPLSDISK